MWIKICGITRVEDAMSAARFGADAIGFVFAESPRRITPDWAREISLSAPESVSRVGVFMDRPPQEVMRIAAYCRLDAVQLHGSEDEEYCGELGGRVIKAIRVDRETDMVSAAEYPVDALLLDGYCGGGNGEGFDWRQVGLLPKSIKVIVAGGLDPGNVKEAIKRVSPYGVDVSSGVESSPGVKDPVLMYRFIESARVVDYKVNGGY